ncbi:TonB-dependent receptor [Cellvibrio zantedeschiae]|uniref:TonB-dependent receptor n=1 Tax=Cellvibrio zantedeschiae TaxID=1237077 RepID=A0ABQ3B927_9GAMM|nr:TonB-dependent receptor [Cellvibrio zantedeschiae]GGY84649.1 TonB-dependent receptor [Cellvibrio zantedeschiae]
MKKNRSSSDHTNLLGGIGGLSVLCASLLSPILYAAPNGETAGDVQEVVVTGSRIKRDGFDASTPVSVISAEDIKLSGKINVEEQLAKSPQFVASTNGGASANTVPGGTADVNLRGFGATRNLVLVNGRRFAIHGPEQVTDLNTIPSALIERTEIVTGGSSAVYGSDAITGVVNFIMRDDFEGVELNAQYGADSPTGTGNYSFDITAGTNFDEGRGNAVISINKLTRGGITRGERGDFAFDSLSDGCVVKGSGTDHSAGDVFNASLASCVSAGGELGFVRGGSGDIPASRISGIPLPGSAQSNAALNAAYTGAGIGNFGAFGVTFDNTGKTARAALDPQDRFNLGPDNYLIIPQERVMANLFSHYDFSEKATGYLELHYSENTVDAQLAPSNVGTTTLLNVNNPYLSAGMQEVLNQLDLRETGSTKVTSGSTSRTTVAGDGLAMVTLGKRYSEVGKRRSETERDVFRGALGIKGELGSYSNNFLSNLNYDVYYTYAKTDTTEDLFNALSRSQLQAALLSNGSNKPVCNVFGLNVDEACAKAIRISAKNTTEASMKVFAASISGDLFQLPAGAVGFAVGTEWRSTSAQYSPDTYLSSGDVVGFNAGLPTGGSLSVKEIFSEMRVPLVKDVTAIKNLTANAAFRYSDYSLSGIGGAATYLGGLEWQVNDDLAFRGQFQRAIRAPNMAELFGGLRRSVETATDPCSSKQPASQQTADVRAVCEATGVPTSQVFTAGVQPNTIIPADFGGNPNVGEETSDTKTLGVVITPSALPNLRLSLDYFDITLDGAIATLGGGLNNTLNLCYNVIKDANSEFCKAVHRDGNTGAITDSNAVQIRQANTGALETSGVDLAMRYSFELSNSKIDVGTDWTYTDDFSLTPVQAFPNVINHCVGSYGATCGEPIPEYRGTTRITWALDNYSFSLRHRYMSAVTIDTHVLPTRLGKTAPALSTLVYPKLPSQQYLDISFTANVMENIQLYGGINNVLDNDPPVVGSAQIRANTYPATYDVLGQEYFIGINAKF